MERKKEKILGVDFGDKKTGIAISLDGLPLGLETIEGGLMKVVSRIQILVDKNNISVVVVGMPIGGVHGRNQSKKVEDFIKNLRKKLKMIRIEIIFEEFTTKMVNRYVKDSKYEHEEVARVLIEDWINKKNY